MVAGSPNWRPGASLDAMRARAGLTAGIRDFFAARQATEVQTPILARYGVSDPNIEGIQTPDGTLQTSPEHHMKRLLAAGSGDIYQIACCFRADEISSRHNREFTLLEWYRLGWSLEQLMEEVAAVAALALGQRLVRVRSYRQVFRDCVGLDPFTAGDDELAEAGRQLAGAGFTSAARDIWLDLLLAQVVEPAMPPGEFVFIEDFPPSQAALARVTEDACGRPVARRFEFFSGGMELANGYCELTDPRELVARFTADNAVRAGRGEPCRQLDCHLLAALEAGLPDCVGVALGLDRLLMLALGAEHISQVLAFDSSRA